MPNGAKHYNVNEVNMLTQQRAKLHAWPSAQDPSGQNPEQAA